MTPLALVGRGIQSVEDIVANLSNVQILVFDVERLLYVDHYLVLCQIGLTYLQNSVIT